MRRLALLLVVALAVPACGKDEGSDRVPCEAPGGCSAVISTLGTGESVAELIADGDGGVYAALLGSGEFPACNGGVVCHGELWRIDRDGDVAWKEKEGKSVSRPFLLPDGGGVAYRTGAGTLVAVDGDGGERWRLPTGDPELVASVVFDDLVVIADGRLARIDADSGDEVWSVAFAETRPASPAGTGDGWVIAMGYSAPGALRARTFGWEDGRAGWTAELPAELSAPAIVGKGRGLAPTLLVSDRLSLRGWGGAEIWAEDGEEGFRFVAPAPGGGYFASGPYLDQITEYRVTGTVLWSRPSGAPLTWLRETPDGNVLAGRNDGVVQKLKGGAGTVLWDYGGVDTVKAQAPPIFASSGNAVFFGANIGLDTDTHLSTITPFGQGLDRWDAGARIISAALSDDDDVFVATLDGTLYLRAAAAF